MHLFVAKLFSIVYHLLNLRPANLLRTPQINFSMQPHAEMRPTLLYSII